MQKTLASALKQECVSKAWSVSRTDCVLAAGDAAQFERCANPVATPAKAATPARPAPPKLADEALCKRAATQQASVLSRQTPSMKQAFERSFFTQCTQQKWTVGSASCVAAADSSKALEACSP